MKNPEGKEEFLEQTSHLEKLAHEHPSASVRVQSHLRLAFLYVNYKNPQLNYARTLQEMKIYLSLVPAKAQTDEFQNWLAVLREMDHLDKNRVTTEGKNQDLQTHIEKLQSSLGKVQEANKRLRDEGASLKEMNNRMGEATERLQSLDRQMEEKRSLIKPIPENDPKTVGKKQSIICSTYKSFPQDNLWK